MNFLSRAVLFVAFIAIQNLAFSQTAQTIRTGRPGVSIGPYVVGTRVFQVQSGLTYDQFRSQNESESYTFDNVIRYGLNESFELSGVINYSHVDLDTNNLSGVSSTQFGGRVNLWDDPNSFIKALCVQFRFKLPWQSSDYKTDDLSGVLLIAFSQDIGDLGLTYNIGASENQTTDKITGNYVVNLSGSFNEKWGSFVEAYGSLDDGDHDIEFDTGLSYLHHRNMMLDISFGGGKNDGISHSFISAGISWRLL